MKRLSLLFLNLLLVLTLRAEDGYSLWSGYVLLFPIQLLSRCREILKCLDVFGNSATMAADKEGVLGGLHGLPGRKAALNNAGIIWTQKELFHGI